MYQFKLPDLGEGIAEVELVEWLVREGEIVAEDQPLAAVQTDKALVEISSPRAGRVDRLCATAGATIPVGQVLVEIDDEAGTSAARVEAAPETRRTAGMAAGEAPPAAAAAPSHGPVSAAHTSPARPPELPPRPQGRPAPVAAGRGKSAEAVPAVRERARQLGVDIQQVAGTGPDGRVMRRDVEAFHAAMQHGTAAQAAGRAALAEPAPADEPDWTRQPLRGVRRLMAERMAQALAVVPHYTLVEEVDVTLLESRRATLAHTAGAERLSPLAFIAEAAVRALADYPRMNGCLDDETGEMILKGRIHLGIAVATDDGLIVPVIRDAAGLRAAQLAARIRDLAERARARRLEPAELKGATFTITSLGKLGGLMATPIINYPASAILGVHAIRTLPRYAGDQVAPRKILNLSVSLDHRIVDGVEGARFLQDVRGILEQADFPELR